MVCVAHDRMETATRANPSSFLSSPPIFLFSLIEAMSEATHPYYAFTVAQLVVLIGAACLGPSLPRSIEHGHWQHAHVGRRGVGDLRRAVPFGVMVASTTRRPNKLLSMSTAGAFRASLRLEATVSRHPRPCTTLSATRAPGKKDGVTH